MITIVNRRMVNSNFENLFIRFYLRSLMVDLHECAAALLIFCVFEKKCKLDTPGNDLGAGMNPILQLTPDSQQLRQVYCRKPFLFYERTAN